MATEVQLIERPLKYAGRAMIIFVVSAFVLSYFYEALALSSMGMPTSASWREIWNIPGLDFGRSLRYFAFYLISFLFFVYYERSPLKSSVWGTFVVVAVFPTAMSFVPFIFSGGLNGSSSWAMTAMLISLLYLRNSTTMFRPYVIALIFTIVLTDIAWQIEDWGNAIHPQAVKIYGETSAGAPVFQSLIWLAPALAIKELVSLYLILWLPKKFFADAGIIDK